MRLARTPSRAVILAALSLHGCARSEAPATVPVTTAVLAPEPSASVAIAPPPPLPVASSARASAATSDDPDAAEEASASDDPLAGPVSASRRAPLRACCLALQQSAASTPPPHSMYLLGASAYCNAVRTSVSSPQQRASALSVIRAQLQGAPLPAACH